MGLGTTAIWWCVFRAPLEENMRFIDPDEDMRRLATLRWWSTLADACRGRSPVRTTRASIQDSPGHPGIVKRDQHQARRYLHVQILFDSRQELGWWWEDHRDLVDGVPWAIVDQKRSRASRTNHAGGDTRKLLCCRCSRKWLSDEKPIPSTRCESGVYWQDLRRRCQCWATRQSKIDEVYRCEVVHLARLFRGEIGALKCLYLKT